MVKKLSQNEFSQAERSALAVVDFSASWCGPCKMLAPVLEAVAEELSGKAEFFNVDVDDAPAVAARFGVQSVPTLVVLKNGTPVDVHVGFAPQAAIRAFVEKQS